MQGSDGVRLIANNVLTKSDISGCGSIQIFLHSDRNIISVTKWYNDAVVLALSVDITSNMP